MDMSATEQALALVSEYLSAQMARNAEGMDALRSEDYCLDLVQDDAKADVPRSREHANRFWRAWFAAFPDADWHITRTVVAPSVVVCEGVFTATHAGPLGPPIVGEQVAPTGRTLRLRGAMVYDVREGRICRETVYLDVATFWVELGVLP